MAKNDAILIDGIIQEIMSNELLNQGEAFELFAFRQILKSYDLTQDELEAGWVDGHNDGGIDGFYTFINGVMLQDTSGYTWPKKNVSIDFWIISCKSEDSFKQAPLNTIFPTIEELLDFTKDPSEFEGRYSKELLDARQIAVQAFLKTASALPSINFNFGYASRGDLNELAENIEARGNQIKRIVNDYFSAAKVEYEYFGASELIELHRKNRIILELPYTEQLSRDMGAFVLLVQIDSYARFVSDEHGQLRRYLFDSNVRDFLGENRVNMDIANSLQSSDSPDFWWMNNGVTILSTSATPLGRTPHGNAIQLHDVQIVNGLQTTQSIYNYFKSDDANANGRCVLIKVIVSENEAIRDEIIQATNNQSQVELASLNATDKIQRDIEDILERSGWYYERRKNYYKNIGKPADRFVTPLYLAVAFISLARKAPQKAGLLKTKFMRNQESYDAVFSEKHPIVLWPKLAEILKAVEVCMIAVVPKINTSGSRILGRWRGAVALCVVAQIHGTFSFTHTQLIETDQNEITCELVENIFLSLRSIDDRKQPNNLRGNYRKNKNSYKLLNLDTICREYAIQNQIKEPEVIGKWNLPTVTTISQQAKQTPRAVSSTPSIKKKIDEKLIESIKELLPPQPWPPGIQKTICAKLSISPAVVRDAITQLINDRVFHNQWTGVVVDHDGYITAIDSSRANPKYIIGNKYSQ